MGLSVPCNLYMLTIDAYHSSHPHVTYFYAVTPPRNVTVPYYLVMTNTKTPNTVRRTSAASQYSFTTSHALAMAPTSLFASICHLWCTDLAMIHHPYPGVRTLHANARVCFLNEISPLIELGWRRGVELGLAPGARYTLRKGGRPQHRDVGIVRKHTGSI